MSLPIPENVSAEHRDAIRLHERRLELSIGENDHGAILGNSKDLSETICKVILTEAPATFGQNDKFSDLVRKANSALNVGGNDTSGKLTVDVARSVQPLAQGLSQLRNLHGAGHGRSTVVSLESEDVEYLLAATQAWSIWALQRLDRLLANSVSTLIRDLDNEIFRRGDLTERLRAVNFESQSAEEQQRLGLAIAHRGVRRQTFVVRQDGIDPLRDDADWPEPYQMGVAAGLLFDDEGFVEPKEAETLSAIIIRLRSPDLDELLERANDTPLGARAAADAEHRLDTCQMLDATASRLSFGEPLIAKLQTLADRFRD